MTPPKHYDLGDLVRVAGVFKNTSNAVVDPDVVSFKFKGPSGTTTTYVYGTDIDLVKDSTGNYHVDIDANAAGWWYYKFFSTGTGQGAAESSFVVNKSQF